MTPMISAAQLPAYSASDAHAPADVSDARSQHFYAILFDRHPELMTLFERGDARRSEHAPSSVISQIIEHLDDPTWIATRLVALESCERHPALTDALEAVAEAILAVLASVEDEEWRDGRVASWVESHRLVAKAAGLGAVRRQKAPSADATWTPLAP
ncbi:hypothetical protein L6R52_28465, partial [Myxococcota bacterium]|nr:hypothetical protein [Myxococcota bacterium]